MPIAVSQLTSQGWQSLTGGGSMEPASTLLVGAASYHAPLTSKRSWTEVLEPQVGPMTIRRSYESEATGIPTSWAVSEASIDVAKYASVHSVRPPIDQFISGAHDARLRTFLRSIPDDGMPKFLVGWHEADSKVRRGNYTRAQYMTAIRRFADIVHNEQIPNTYVTPCWTAWLWHDPAKGAGQPEQWWQDSVYDVLSVDYYDDTPSAMFDPVVIYAAAHGVPWAVAETGWTSQTVKAQRITDTATYCATHAAGGWPSAAFMCWFDSDVGFDEAVAAQAFTPTSSPAAITAANAACQKYYRNPTTLTLRR
ncbi:hypothetical protein [Actinomadura sp. WMMA1423]|uniref:hypothetical protein n=1 Tax=Actinomadura sp. WMMA1423 TaxID=2591108 RepID=UPI001147059C|nr:hypothetical protein [Actinomadura sp. WMMA1423]